MTDAADPRGKPSPARWRITAFLAGRLRPRRSWWPFLAAGLAPVALATAVLVASPETRRWLAERLDSGRTTLVFLSPGQSRPAVLPHAYEAPDPLGPRLALEEAVARMDFEALVPTDQELGVPDFAFAGPGLDGGIALAWNPDETGQPVDGWGASVLLVEAPAETALPAMTPVGGTAVSTVTVNGAHATWVSGGHQFLDADTGTVHNASWAPSTLIWQVDDLLLRLESWLPRDRAIAIAESVGT